METFEREAAVPMDALGSHLLLDLWNVPDPYLDDRAALRQMLVRSAWAGGATVVDTRFTDIQPQGVSGMVMLAESHLAVHTWPDRRFAAIDVFATSDDPELCLRIAAEVIAALQPVRYRLHRVDRGVGPGAKTGITDKD